MKIIIHRTSAAHLISVLLLTFAISCTPGRKPASYEALSVVPAPASMETTEGSFLLTSGTGIVIDPAFITGSQTVEMFNRFLEKHYGKIRVSEIQAPSDEGVIRSVLDSLAGNTEAYRLKVASGAITIEAGGDAGLFYAFQTLMQLIFPSQEAHGGGIEIPCVKISDSPRYRWRGMHLDVSRHFFPKEFIFKMLDAMAMHKLNTFHWHLTDDQGWRIEIRKYPELTAVGAWRDETLIGHGSETPWRYDGTRYGGFYTQEDVREVVEYAAKLHINVLPEIEMPGHAVAALKAYPELSCTGGPIPSFNRWGVSEDVFCAGKEETFEFLTGVLEEVAELFPYEYIHIGGDECPKVRWHECELCQKRIEDNNLKDEHELQSYFIKRVEAFLSLKGKKIIGWDEIREGGIAGNAAVMSWRGHSGGIQAANMGHDVVMTPHSFVYLDYYQSKYNEPLAIGGMLDMKKVYTIDIMPAGIEEERRKHIIGAQANVWTEYMPDSRHVEYMVFPRLAALAEALWTSEASLDYDDFTERMNAQYARYDAMDIAYRVPYPEGAKPDNVFTDDSVSVTLVNSISSSQIYYTLDGTTPDGRSELYAGPFALSLEEDRTLKAVTVMRGGRRSEVMSALFRKEALRSPVAVDKIAPGLLFKLFRGDFSSAHDLPANADSTGVVETIKIPTGAPAASFGLELTGFIEVEADGIYTFYCTSDDGVLLYIDGDLIVDGDLVHHGVVNEGQAALKAGLHDIRVLYFQRLYRQSLGVSYDGPGIPRQPLQVRYAPDNLSMTGVR